MTNNKGRVSTVAARTSCWRADLVKALLCLAGVMLLRSTSRGFDAVIVMAMVSALAYGLGARLCARPAGALHRWVGRLAVPSAFALLVLFNVLGFVGTLTGSGSSVEAGASAWIAMPFYLLSAAAFLVDMANRRASLPRVLDFLTYMFLPFKLLAGPLETPRLLEQIGRYVPRFRLTRLLAAWPWLALGGFMKYVIANRLDPARHLVLTDPVSSFATAAIFELKFYFDFAGYSFLAYGGALAVGLRISHNFNHPFLAPNVVLFWRSWHMSLGRFLTRYVLEPNLSLWKGRTRKLLFASAIFLVSAMWHGGTINYLLWGLFHGVVYFGYGHWMKRRSVNSGIGLLAMLLFFVFGRLLAIDADGGRLLLRLARFFDPTAYALPVGGTDAMTPFLSPSEAQALILASAFIALEIVSSRMYPSRNGYHLMRRPLVALAFTLLFLVFGRDAGTLLYARI
jgi:alginate O-acetyltransferase complex protein AlgI